MVKRNSEANTNHIKDGNVDVASLDIGFCKKSRAENYEHVFSALTLGRGNKRPTSELPEMVGREVTVSHRPKDWIYPAKRCRPATSMNGALISLNSLPLWQATPFALALAKVGRRVQSRQPASRSIRKCSNFRVCRQKVNTALTQIQKAKMPARSIDVHTALVMPILVQ
jgi:hypothetical protein